MSWVDRLRAWWRPGPTLPAGVNPHEADQPAPDAGVPHEAVMLELRGYGIRFDDLIRRARRACDHSRNEWLLKHTDGRWCLVDLRRDGRLPQAHHLGRGRYAVTPGTLPKPVLRYRWDRAPGFVP